MADFGSTAGYKCKMCRLSFSHEGAFRMHEWECWFANGSQEVQTPEENYQCTECKEILKSKQGLKNHLLKHDVHNYVCKECGLSFAFKKSLLKHMNDHVSSIDNEEVEVNHNCQKCGTHFPSRESLERSVANNSKSYGCPVCHAQMHPAQPAVMTHAVDNGTYKRLLKQKVVKQLEGASVATYDTNQHDPLYDTTGGNSVEECDIGPDIFGQPFVSACDSNPSASTEDIFIADGIVDTIVIKEEVI